MLFYFVLLWCQYICYYIHCSVIHLYSFCFSSLHKVLLARVDIYLSCTRSCSYFSFCFLVSPHVSKICHSLFSTILINISFIAIFSLALFIPWLLLSMNIHFSPLRRSFFPVSLLSFFCSVSIYPLVGHHLHYFLATWS